MNLFLTGFLQVSFVAANTFFISTKNLSAVFICGFAISLIWSFNVKRIAFSTKKQRIIYAFGAAAGSVTGCAAASFFSSI